MIDLRSDTVTRPGPAMRQAMAAADVGDDVWGDDPTVNALCEKIAAITSKDAGLFLPSATQSNLAAVMAHCERGDEYIAGEHAHIYKYEGGGAAVLGSVQPHPIANAADGSLPLEKIAAAVKPDDPHFARTRLLALENTIDGKVLPQAYVSAATELARTKGLATHLDGARLFNAAVAQGETAAALCAPFDTVSICFSKGLGAPVGSALVGPHDVIHRAKRWRKVLGGGLRQAGILAAACLYALDHHVDRLAEDHAHAQALAQGLSAIAGLGAVRQATNMVFVTVPPDRCQALQAHLGRNGVLAAVGPKTRLVTHLDVSAAAVAKVVATVAAFFNA